MTNIERIQEEAYKRGRQEARVEVAMLWWNAGDMTHRIIRKYSLDEEEQELFYTGIRKAVAKHGYCTWAWNDTVIAFKRMVRRKYPLQKIGYLKPSSPTPSTAFWEDNPAKIGSCSCAVTGTTPRLPRLPRIWD